MQIAPGIPGQTGPVFFRFLGVIIEKPVQLRVMHDHADHGFA